MAEAFEDMTSCPGLWSDYASHPWYKKPNAEETLLPNEEVGRAPNAEDQSATGVSTVGGYLVISNISKKENVKKMISVAVAFGIENVVIG